MFARHTSPWRGDIHATRPQSEATATTLARPVVVIDQIAQEMSAQHPLAVYEGLLDSIRDELEVAA